jgi:hypothetical protein
MEGGSGRLWTLRALPIILEEELVEGEKANFLGVKLRPKLLQ